MCGECARLRAENEALRDEVKAWKDFGAPEEGFTAGAVRIGLEYQQAVILARLLASPGRAVTHDSLVGSMELRKGRSNGERDPNNTVLKTQICRARKRLAPVGVTIRTEWGLGYSLDAADAQKLRDLVAA